MSWAILITAIGLIWVIWKRKKLAPWWLKAALVAIAGCALADVALGAWLANRLMDLLSNIPGVPPTLIVGGAVLVGLLFVFYAIWVDKSADKREMVVLFLLPTLLLPAVGPLANAGESATAGTNEISSGSIGRLIGG
ncbi:hypothetical protein [Saccharopolyspora taberi]|uniref:Uncharacterized protein n=1 Tax=Saccharopolyspora taberi TaxID=60895 RepID=A0ABN3V1F9_9PSEU